MKRTGNLFTYLCSFDNLLAAARLARRGKRSKGEVLEFDYALEPLLFELQGELISRNYRHGGYRQFTIHEPKERLISAAAYRDRVVHHALCRLIDPIFDRGMIDSSYANRRGKGTHKALDHFVRLSKQYRYCLRADIVKYFANIDHEILKDSITRKLKCTETLWLIGEILDASMSEAAPLQYFPGDTIFTPVERRRGLPIGNLTSQLWANVHLGPVDHAMVKAYGGTRYVRYVDDVAIFSNDEAELRDARAHLVDELANLRLTLHPVKTQVSQTTFGVNFLGFRVFPDRVRLRQENLRRARRRMRGLARDFRTGEKGWGEVKQSLQGWNAHAAYGDTYRLRERVFDGLVFSRS